MLSLACRVFPAAEMLGLTVQQGPFFAILIVAFALAHGPGHNPEAFVAKVASAAVAACLTAIGHHGNLLIYGPGRCQFADFVRVGTPLTTLTVIVTVVIAQLVGLYTEY